MTTRLPRQERLRSRSYSLGQSAGSVVISLRIKKPAAKHPFKPLVLRLRLKYAGKPVAAKIKASTKKAIPFSQKFDEVIISEANTQRKYCFLTRMDFFSGFLRRQNSCRNPFEIRQLLREVGYWVVRSFPLASIPSVRVSEKLFIYLHNYSTGGIGGITTNIDFNSSIVPALTHSDIPFFHTKLSALN